MEGNYNNRPQAPKGARLAFGVFMVLISSAFCSFWMYSRLTI